MTNNMQIFLSGLADAVPGSNEFADQGANPIWKVIFLTSMTFNHKRICLYDRTIWWDHLTSFIIHQEAMESNDFEEDFKFEDDAISESSGDSILIGVEDQTEFDDYTEKIKEIDVDMDLYSKLQGNRQAK